MTGIHGVCDPRFARVADIFAGNFERGEEIGATVVAYVGDELAVNLWGGAADERTGAPWQADTPCPIFSMTKILTATAALMLSERGLFDVEAPVTEWWPEFGRHGKERTTGAHLLSHQAGLPYLETDVSTAGAADAERVADLLANQSPVWEPGTKHGYHSLTFGWLVGETVRRFTGGTVGEFLATAIAKPWGLDLWMGAPDDVLARTAKVGALPAGEEDAYVTRMASRFADPASLLSRSFASPRALAEPGAFNNPDVLRVCWPAITGLATGLGLAGFFRDLLAGRLVSPETLLRAARTRVSGVDEVCGVNLAFGLGFLRPCPPVFSVPAQAEESVLGHFGAGGGFGFGDWRHNLSMAYLPNGMRGQFTTFSRSYRMVEAAYAAL
jgi:CubicO group peptidase (beta-lactamase class C family)